MNLILVFSETSFNFLIKHAQEVEKERDNTLLSFELLDTRLLQKTSFLTEDSCLGNRVRRCFVKLSLYYVPDTVLDIGNAAVNLRCPEGTFLLVASLIISYYLPISHNLNYEFKTTSISCSLFYPLFFVKYLCLGSLKLRHKTKSSRNLNFELSSHTVQQVKCIH